ncbi:MAG: hypothetical protein VB876_07845 [Pirellulales bacterium]
MNTNRILALFAMMAFGTVQALPAQTVTNQLISQAEDCDAKACDAVEADCGCEKGNCCCFAWGTDWSINVGAGIRTSYNAHDSGNPGNGAAIQDFNLNNARIYLNGQGHDRIGFEFNTDINNAQGFQDNHNGSPFGTTELGEMRVLDAVLKFDMGCNAHIWFGRFLPPSDRSNLSGPFYLNAWNFPFVQLGYNNIFQGRDDGVALWGERGGGRFKWSVGLFDGENLGGRDVAGQPGVDNLEVAARVTLNLLDPEPGYYNSSTYYGEKDILAIGLAVQHRSAALATSDSTNWNVDVLFEKALGNCGVLTLEGAYYEYNDNFGSAPSGGPVLNPVTGGTRQGDSHFLLASYLLPREVCLAGYPGKWQVMARYQEYNHDAGVPVAEQWDLQLNYIMFGHDARLSAVWSELDTTSGSAGSLSNTFTLGAQVQF